MPAEHSTRRRVIYFDILRIVAIFFVVFVHLAAQHWADVDVSSRAWFAFNLYCTTGKWSVPIFVMISGALFLGRDVSISSILKKNVARIATVFLFWSGCYALIDLVFRHAPLSVVLSQFITGHYHLWFLYMIVGLYLLIPLLRPIAQSETLMRYFLLLALIFTFLLPQLVLYSSFISPEPTSLGTVKLNGNAAEGNDTITVQDGTVYESLNPETGEVQGATAVPGKGSVFVGWYDAQDTERSHPLTDGSTTYTPEKEDSSGRYQKGSYVALFRLKQYVLHYDANATDAVGTMKDQTFPHGEAYPLTKCAFSREGYRFVGWATEQEGEVKYEDQKNIKLDEKFQNLTNDNEKVNLYAVWEEQSVTLSYEPNDAELGTVSSALETVAAVKGTAKGSTAQPKSGARFDGWYSADGTLLSKELTFVPTKGDGAVWQGTTYYAHFSAKRSPSTPSTPAKPDETKPTLAPIPEMLNGEDHYAYLLGYEDGTVRPNGSISRAEVATVLFRLLKDDVRTQNLTKDNAYSDVSDTAWYAAAVSTLSKMGVISGYPDGTFRPNAPITRAEFAAMIARFDETAKSADTPFTDISGHWAENAIGKAYGNGWVEGSSKTVFCPESNLTRAETATLLNRVLHRLPEKESDLLANQIVWPDNPETFWGYLAIQEATNSHEYERKADGVHETQTAKRENRDWSKEFEQ